MIIAYITLCVHIVITRYCIHKTRQQYCYRGDFVDWRQFKVPDRSPLTQLLCILIAPMYAFIIF